MLPLNGRSLGPQGQTVACPQILDPQVTVLVFIGLMGDPHQGVGGFDAPDRGQAAGCLVAEGALLAVAPLGLGQPAFAAIGYRHPVQRSRGSSALARGGVGDRAVTALGELPEPQRCHRSSDTLARRR